MTAGDVSSIRASLPVLSVRFGYLINSRPTCDYNQFGMCFRKLDESHSDWPVKFARFGHLLSIVVWGISSRCR